MLSRASKLFAATTATALLLAGCGSDEPSKAAAGTGDNPAAAEDLQVFCDAAVDAKTAVMAAAEGLPADDPAPLLDAVEAAAPEAIADDVTVVVGAARDALESQDESGLESDEFREGDAAIDAFVGEKCESQKVSVTAIDYGFKDLPATLSSGRTTVEFTNGGSELHEMLIMRIDEPGIEVKDLLKMPQKQAEKKVTFVRGLFAPPGESDVENFDLEPGEYAVLCFVPMGSTDFAAAKSAKGPPHAMKGMTAQITVR